MLKSAYSRAVKKNITFKLDRDWLDKKLEIGMCCKTNISFIYEFNSPYTPSIDRIDSSKGYTKENCQIVCKMYNFAKNMWTDDDVLNMAKKLLEKLQC